MTAPLRGLGAFFAARGVAVIGASADQRAGGRVLAALDRFGYRGGIYPVTRSHAELVGRPCFRAIADVPDPVDLAVIAIGASAVPDTLRECGKRGIPAAIVFATGFGGETADGPRLQRELEAALRESGVRILGPNTLGLRFVPSGLFATFAHDVDSGVRPGNVAVIAQSGGLGVYLGAATLRRRLVGTRYLVDTGNELDLGSGEVLEHIAADREVSCVGLLLEGSRDGRRLAAAVDRAVGSGIPVVFFKVGRSRAASTHITSHTGALASSAELFDAAMRDAGASVAHDEAEFLDALVIHDAGKAPKGRRLGVVTPSGGYAILTLDAAERYGMELPQPTVPPTEDEAPDLRSGTLRNPYDWASVGGALAGTRAAAVGWMLRQPNVDAVLLWEAYNMEMERRDEVYAALARVLPGATKPLFACGTSTPQFEETLKGLGVILFNEPMRLVRSLSVVAPPAEPAAALPD
ncbi:MAG: CoA-binding protein, partial [Chloroflexota bacterium]|nr:CoA-binding protein [Chloroflexota bacterium]